MNRKDAFITPLAELLPILKNESFGDWIYRAVKLGLITSKEAFQYVTSLDGKFPPVSVFPR
jgi:hypothetical protein